MRLKVLTGSLDCEVIGVDDVEVLRITADSRDVSIGTGALFAAIRGQRADGSDFIGAAVKNGAVCVLSEREANVPVPQIIAPDCRAALSRLSSVLYGEPSKELIVTGVTGTNGKTTTAYLLEAILAEAGFNPGVIGTVNYRYNGRTFPAPHTTPDAPHLHGILRDMADAGVTHCVMEVSSHGLAQKRVNDCRFTAGVFTNLTHEHLDYHRTMEEYFRSKSILFSLLKASGGFPVINTDDPWGRMLKKEYPSAITFGIRDASITPLDFRLRESSTEAEVSTPAGCVHVSTGLVGEYNLKNILGAIGAAYALGVDCRTIGRGVSALRRVPGRLERIEIKGRAGSFRAYVDYAHTGDALERALRALKSVSGGRVITVFGCGGNRDRLKRPVMGSVSGRLSDITIITSDNPRDEDPLEIIKEIESGMKGVRICDPAGTLDGNCYTVIPERGTAIRKAVQTAREGDAVLIAGKGHEDYQIIKGKKTHFDDFEALNEAIRDLQGFAGKRNPPDDPNPAGLKMK